MGATHSFAETANGSPVPSTGKSSSKHTKHHPGATRTCYQNQWVKMVRAGEVSKTDYGKYRFSGATTVDTLDTLDALPTTTVSGSLMKK